MSNEFDSAKISSCKYSYLPNFEHRYIIVEQRQKYNASGFHFYLCKCCGLEKPLEDSFVMEKEHQHNYMNYCGCMNGFYILRCTQYGCNSFLKIFNTNSQECSNKDKRHLEDD